MSTKSLLLATLAGAITGFILGYILHGLLLFDFFADNMGSATGVSKDLADVSLPLIFLGNIALSLLVTIIYGRWASIKTFATGAKAGAIIGLLVGAYFDLIFLGVTNIMQPTSAIVDIVVSAIIGAVVGGVVGLVLGKTAD